MKTGLKKWLFLPLLLVLAGCAGTEREQVGTVIGGAAGGLLGSQVGEGSGRTAAIIAGAILGGAAGRSIGTAIDKSDEEKAQAALERNRAATWVNPDTNAQVTVTPRRTFEGEGSRYCREYSTDIVVGGKVEHGYGTACRQPDGSWEMRAG
ncbi:MAG: glycine zipper 2TM domain-containing protein [Deltaproteobacteria bacterium]|nr:glycine zipper 2TM domain-containing protein [Deltaproteobacteria bacterium]